MTRPNTPSQPQNPPAAGEPISAARAPGLEPGTFATLRADPAGAARGHDADGTAGGAGRTRGDHERSLEAALLQSVQREFRIAVNWLRNCIGQVAETSTDPAHKELARSAMDWTRTIGMLTTELLDFSRMLSGQTVAQPVEFLLGAALEELRRAPAGVDGPADFKLDVKLERDVPVHLNADPSRIRQVLQLALRSLLPDLARPAASLAVRRLAEDGERVRIELALRADRAPRSGEARPRPVAAPARPGANRPVTLDRLMAERLAAALGGELALCDDAPGSIGWTFRLPVRKAAPRAPVVETPVSLKGRRVLVASASGPLRVSLQMSLRSIGCENEVVEEGGSAVRALRAAVARGRRFDAVVVDLLLHGLDGEQLAAAIHADEQLRGTPLVMLTDVGSPGDADWASASGFAAYLVKPVKAPELSAVLSRVLGARGRDASDPAAARTDLVTRHSLRESKRPTLRVLAVDDDRVNLLMVRHALERMGHAVVTAETGAEALEAWGREAFDVVLLDVRLPDIDGDQVALTLRARERGNSGTPALIVCMSASEMADDRERCSAAGADDFLKKPVAPTALAPFLERAAARRGPPAAAGAATAPDALADLIASLEGAWHRDVGAAEASPPPAAAAAARETSPIEMAHLEVASMGIPSLRREMLETLVAEVQAGLARFEEALNQRDPQGVRAEADLLHSLCNSVGAHALAEMMAPLAAAGADLDALARALPALRQEWRRLQVSALDLREAA